MYLTIRSCSGGHLSEFKTAHKCSVTFFFFFKLYLFIERDSEQGRGRERGTERIPSRLCADRAPSNEPGDHDPGRSLESDTQPAEPPRCPQGRFLLRENACLSLSFWWFAGSLSCSLAGRWDGPALPPCFCGILPVLGDHVQISSSYKGTSPTG